MPFMPAITFYAPRMESAGRLSGESGWKVIFCSDRQSDARNSKRGLVAVLRHRKLFQQIAILSGVFITEGSVLTALLH